MDRFGKNKPASFLLSLLVTVVMCSAAMAASFEPIDISGRFSFSRSDYAVPADISPNGNRLVGNIAQPNTIFDCPSFLGCTKSFSWEFKTGTTVGSIYGFPATIPTQYGDKGLHAASMVATSNDAVLAHADVPFAYSGPVLLRPAGFDQIAEGLQEPYRYHAVDMSANGTVVVGGASRFQLDGLSYQGFRWTIESGLEPFGDEGTSPIAISGDGRVVVGRLNIL